MINNNNPHTIAFKGIERVLLKHDDVMKNNVAKRVLAPYLESKAEDFRLFIGGPKREAAEAIIKENSKVSNKHPYWIFSNLKNNNVEIPRELERKGDFETYMIFGKDDLKKYFKFLKKRSFLDRQILRFFAHFCPEAIPKEYRFSYASIEMYKRNYKAFEKFFNKNGGNDVNFQKIYSDYLDEKF